MRIFFSTTLLFCLSTGYTQDFQNKITKKFYHSEEIQAFLEEEGISLPIEECQSFYEDDECYSKEYHAYNLNDQIIVNFPQKYTPNYILIKKVLDDLQPKVAIEVPRISHIGNDNSYFIYPKIEGTSLTPDLYSSLSDEYQLKLAEKLANFFVKFHTLYSVEDAENLGIEREQKQILSELHQRVPSSEKTKNELEALLPQDQFAEIRHSVFSNYPSIANNPDYLGIVHNNVQGKYLFYDTNKDSLNGLMYFDDIAIGDVRRAFRYLYFVDPKLMKDTARIYAQMRGYEEEQFVKEVFVFLTYRELTNLRKILVTPKVASDDDFRVIYRLHQFQNSEDMGFLN